MIYWLVTFSSYHLSDGQFICITDLGMLSYQLNLECNGYLAIRHAPLMMQVLSSIVPKKRSNQSAT